MEPIPGAHYERMSRIKARLDRREPIFVSTSSSDFVSLIQSNWPIHSQPVERRILIFLILAEEYIAGVVVKEHSEV